MSVVLITPGASCTSTTGLLPKEGNSEAHGAREVALLES
jgi:hypothetical protein